MEKDAESKKKGLDLEKARILEEGERRIAEIAQKEAADGLLGKEEQAANQSSLLDQQTKTQCQTYLPPALILAWRIDKQ